MTMLQSALFLLFGLFAAPPLAAMQTPSAHADSADARLAKLAKSDCPAGLEHFLPGVYYYCVGGKALAERKYAKARSMFEIAAAWGSKQAQFMLGVGYYKGDTGVLDRPLGLAWLTLAAERQTSLFVAVLHSAQAHASEREQVRAEQLLAMLAPRYADAHAAHRAFRRYQEFRRQLIAAAPYGGQFCIAGLTSSSVVSERTGLADDGSCVGQQSASSVARQLDGYAEVLLDGWQGRVTVGGIEPVPADRGR